MVDLDLYRQERAAGPMEDVIQRMRSDITVKLESKESFRVSYISDHPEIAQKVAARRHVHRREFPGPENLAQGTSVFLESQLAEAKRQLIEQEKRLEAYRKRYAGQLPSQLGGNLQGIQNVQMQLQTVNEAMNRARERRLLIERQIADAQSVSSGIDAWVHLARRSWLQPLSNSRQRGTNSRHSSDVTLPITRTFER